MNNDNRILRLSEIPDLNQKIKTIVKQVIALDYKVIDNLKREDEGNFKQWLGVFRKNAPFCYLIFNKDKIIGYMHVVILTKEVDALMKEGLFLDSQITEDTTDIPISNKNYNLYIAAICILEQYQRLGLGSMLYDYLMNDINTLKQKKINIDNIMANAYTVKGKNFLTKKGFHKIANNFNKGDMVIKEV